MFHVKHGKELNMLIMIIIGVVILLVCCVIGETTLGKSTKFYTDCILDEYDKHYNYKIEVKEDDTFFNHD